MTEGGLEMTVDGMAVSHCRRLPQLRGASRMPDHRRAVAKPAFMVLCDLFACAGSVAEDVRRFTTGFAYRELDGLVDLSRM